MDEAEGEIGTLSSLAASCRLVGNLGRHEAAIHELIWGKDGMTSRRNVLQFGAAMLGGILLGAKVEPAAAFGPVRPQKRPLVTGPTKGGRHGQPFGGYFGDIAQRGDRKSTRLNSSH